MRVWTGKLWGPWSRGTLPRQRARQSPPTGNHFATLDQPQIAVILPRHKLHGRVIVSCGETRAVTPTCMCTSKTPRIGEEGQRKKVSRVQAAERILSLRRWIPGTRKTIAHGDPVDHFQPAARGTMIARSVSRSSPISFRSVSSCFVRRFQRFSRLRGSNHESPEAD